MGGHQVLSPMGGHQALSPIAVFSLDNKIKIGNKITDNYACLGELHHIRECFDIF